MKKYSYDIDWTFGWKGADWQNPTEKELEHNGQFCKTGFATPLSEFEAKCNLAESIVWNG